MNGLTRYMMLSGGNRAPDTNGNRMEYGGGMQNQMRSGYDNGMRTENIGRTGSMRNEYRVNDLMESRFRDDRGREHYDNGKYAPMRSAYGDDDISRSGGYYGEMYNDDESRRSWEIIENKSNMEMPMIQGGEWAGKPNVIGFAAASSNVHGAHMTRDMAVEWMDNIVNEDGTKGPHWSLDEVKRLMQQKGVESDPIKMWVAMNAEYSDRQKVNKKYGVDRPDFYFDSAIAFWLKDADAVKDKLGAYYTHVAKH